MVFFADWSKLLVIPGCVAVAWIMAPAKAATTGEYDAGKPTCDLDLDLLECPICTEPLSAPVYQCQNGHSLCSSCHKKVERCPSCATPLGSSRCLLAEKILESLQVRCKNASYGCKQMLKYSTIGEHQCDFQPCPCPVPGCVHEAPKSTIAQHLEDRHEVQSTTIRWNPASGSHAVKFKLTVPEEDVFPGILLLKDEGQKVQLLLHREAFGNLGYFFFCTTFGDGGVKYDLQICADPRREAISMIANAVAEDVSRRQNWSKDAVFVAKTTDDDGDESVAVVVSVSFKGSR